MGPAVTAEWLHWRRAAKGKPFRFLDYRDGKGQVISGEEPENFLHPRLLPELAEECRTAAARSQLLATTHSPFFLNGLRPSEVRVLYRDDNGYTQVVRAADIQGVREFIEAGASLGHLWMEGHFGVGDPLVRGGAPAEKGKSR